MTLSVRSRCHRVIFCVHKFKLNCSFKFFNKTRNMTDSTSHPELELHSDLQPESAIKNKIDASNFSSNGNDMNNCVLESDCQSNESCSTATDSNLKSCKDAVKDGTDESQTLHKKGYPMSRRALKRLKNKQVRMEGGQKKQKTPNVKPSYDQQDFAETSYYIQNGLRKVYPYYFNFKTYAKGRWYGRKLMDVFSEEFGVYSPESYKTAVESGLLTVNGKTITVDYKVKNQDHINHRIHRHEMPVTADAIEILSLSSDIVVINKPSSIPVHPCGRYRHNSIVYILGREHGLTDLKLIYRLDRLTSGVLILCRTNEKTAELMDHMTNHRLQKEYVCRVVGEFPSGIIECSEPLDSLSRKVGIFRVCPDGKPSKTTFERLSYNGHSSVVKCQPRTGRTHQIRVHLQYLGYPIINDTMYNNDTFGPMKGKGGEYGKSLEQLIEDVNKYHDRTSYIINAAERPVEQLTSNEHNLDSDHYNEGDSIIHKTEDTIDNDPTESEQGDPGMCEHQDKKQKTHHNNDGTHPDASSTFDASKMSVDPACSECKIVYRDPLPEELVMYLHALRYKGPGWEFSTDLPHWARDDWVDK